MQKLVTVIVSLGAIAAIASAQAQETTSSSSSSIYATGTENPNGAYVGAGWGRFNLDIDNLSDVGSTVTTIAHSSDNAWKVFAGYRFNPYIALEGDYINFGTPSDRFATTASGSNGNYRVDISGFAPYLIGTAPLGPVELFAKVGYLYYNVDTRINFDSPAPGTPPGIDSSHSRTDFLYGGGIGVTFFQRLHASAEYEVVDIKNASNSNALWLNVAWRF